MVWVGIWCFLLVVVLFFVWWVCCVWLNVVVIGYWIWLFVIVTFWWIFSLLRGLMRCWLYVWVWQLVFLVYFLDCGSGVGCCGYFLVRRVIGWLVRVLVLSLFGCCVCDLLGIGSWSLFIWLFCFALRVVFGNVAGLRALRDDCWFSV